MLSIEEQKSIIEKFVKANKNFHGNEDLFDDFCSESMQKSYMMFNSINSEQKVENYISKVVHTSILVVLKNYGRVRRSKNKYVSTKEIGLENDGYSISPYINKESTISSSYIFDLPDPRKTAEEILITKDCLQRVANSVCVIHKEFPSKQYLDIFYLRYIKNYKQSEIAKQLGLSQAEISKRLMKLSELISNVLDVARS